MEITDTTRLRQKGNKFIAELILCVRLVLVRHVCRSVVVWSLTTVVGNHSLGCSYFAAVALLQSYPLRESFTGCIGGFLFEFLTYFKVLLNRSHPDSAVRDVQVYHIRKVSNESYLQYESSSII